MRELGRWWYGSSARLLGVLDMWQPWSVSSPPRPGQASSSISTSGHHVRMTRVSISQAQTRQPPHNGAGGSGRHRNATRSRSPDRRTSPRSPGGGNRRQAAHRRKLNSSPRLPERRRSRLAAAPACEAPTTPAPTASPSATETGAATPSEPLEQPTAVAKASNSAIRSSLNVTARGRSEAEPRQVPPRGSVPGNGHATPRACPQSLRHMS